MTLTKRYLLVLNKIIRKNVFCRRGFVRVLFGVRVAAPHTVQSYCEWGSVMLRFVMTRYIRPGAKVLDVGTGAHAVLAIFAKKRFENVSVVATDIQEETVSWASETAAKNTVDVGCVVADVFEGINDRFDIILCNPAYIPSSVLEALGYKPEGDRGLVTRRCRVADGGPDGLGMIRSFMHGLAEHLTGQGRAIMCANPFHCSERRLIRLVRSAHLTVERIHRWPGIMNVYVVTVPQRDHKKKLSGNGASF